MTDFKDVKLEKEEKLDRNGDHSPSDNEKFPEDPIAVLNRRVPDPDAGLSEQEKKRIDRKLLSKLDFRLIPWLCLLYLLAFLDRTNIGNAKIDGLQEDLHMTDNEYNDTLTIFFISYSVFEPLTQILLKKFRPSIFIPTIMVLWGICTGEDTVSRSTEAALQDSPNQRVLTCMGLVHNFGGLMATRWFLGLAEAGLFPGVNYYLSCWYKRSEFGVRAAIFFSAAAVAGSFGGLLAAAIADMDGVGGKPGWAWIFILEGLATFLIGLISYFVVQDFPAEAKFLSDVDRRRVIRRLELDNQSGVEHEEFKMKYVWASLQDWKTYTGMLIYMGCDGALYAFSLFLPTIIKNLGYTSTKAQLLTVPPYAVAAICTVAVGYIADRTGQRGYCNMFMACFGVIGFSMLIGSGNPHVQYAGTYLGAIGIYPTISNTISWSSNNIEGVYKRGISLGFIIGWGNLNGIVASNIYRKADSPRYFPGHGTVLGYEAVFLLGGSILQHVLLRRENAKRARGERDSWIEGKTEEEIELLGDKRPDFRYTL